MAVSAVSAKASPELQPWDPEEPVPPILAADKELNLSYHIVDIQLLWFLSSGNLI